MIYTKGNVIEVLKIVQARQGRQYYSMRKVIDEIMARVRNSLSDQETIRVAVEAMEQVKVSLDRFIKGIKEARKLRR